METDRERDWEVRRNVTAAVAFLDKHAPEDWRSRVNVDQIQTMSRRWCILGQVYEGSQASSDDGAYFWAVGHLAGLDEEGFAGVQIAFANYDNEWKRQLRGED